jgi:hypothetical protein
LRPLKLSQGQWRISGAQPVNLFCWFLGFAERRAKLDALVVAL